MSPRTLATGQAIREPRDTGTFLRGIVIGVVIGIGVMVMLAGCSHPIYPITAGSHAATSKVDLEGRYVVWSNHPGVRDYITSLLLSSGRPVVERSRLDALFQEQRVRLSHANDEDVLRIGRLVGATHVIFAEVKGAEPPKDSYYWRVYQDQSVAVRSVAIESGEIRWAGLAAYPEPSTNFEQSVMALTYWAIMRAMCDGTWEELTATQKGGCQGGQTAQFSPVTKGPSSGTEPKIWTELQKMEQAEYQRLIAQKQALEKQKHILDEQKTALDKEQAAVDAENDPQRKQQLLADYMPKYNARVQQIEVFKQQLATYEQQVQAYNQRQANARR